MGKVQRKRCRRRQNTGSGAPCERSHLIAYQSVTVRADSARPGHGPSGMIAPVSVSRIRPQSEEPAKGIDPTSLSNDASAPKNLLISAWLHGIPCRIDDRLGGAKVGFASQPADCGMKLEPAPDAGLGENGQRSSGGESPRTRATAAILLVDQNHIGFQPLGEGDRSTTIRNSLQRQLK